MIRGCYTFLALLTRTYNKINYSKTNLYKVEFSLFKINVINIYPYFSFNFDKGRRVRVTKSVAFSVLTDRQTEPWTDRQTDRQNDRQTQRKIKTEIPKINTATNTRPVGIVPGVRESIREIIPHITSRADT